MTLHKPNINRVNDIAYTKFGLNLYIHSKDISKTHIMTPNKGRNSIANLHKMTHPNLDLVNEKVFTKFGFNLLIFIRSQDIERKRNCASMTMRERERE